MVKIFAIFVFIAFIGLSYESPVIYGNDTPGNLAQIEYQNSNIDPIGNYEFAYKQTDLQERQEKGEVAINPQTGNYTLDNVVGSYRYVRPDGLWQIVEYRADGKGFAPVIRTEPYIQAGAA